MPYEDSRGTSGGNRSIVREETEVQRCTSNQGLLTRGEERRRDCPGKEAW